MTVFVGPNNSGKSKVLQEIEQYCRSGQTRSNALILDELEFAAVPPAVASSAISSITVAPQLGEARRPGHIVVGGPNSRVEVVRDQLLRVIVAPQTNRVVFCQWFLAHSILMLDGHNRINLVRSRPGGDLQAAPVTSLQVLFRDSAKRSEVRRIVADAFGAYFAIDPTNLGHLRIRLSSRPPADELEEKGIHDDAVRFHAAAKPIEESSDGVKAFVGMISEVIAGDPRVLLIDEPEAFLHPSLAFKLGYEVSQAARRADKRVFASTHSSNFMMGCIQSGAPVTIVRLTYRNNVATARVLPSDEILELMRNPLLRSTGVMAGLFYEFVVVTESDADRAFYQEVNDRLLQYKPEWGIPNCLFVNAQNKQTVPTIVRPLRRLGIPVAGIVDVDVVKEGGSVWAKLLEGAFVPELARQPLASHRAAILDAMKRTGRDMKREGGLEILDADELRAAKDLFDQLEAYGIFPVPGGELESWLKHLGATGHGPSWLVMMFEKMKEEASDPGFAKPTNGDVWEFIGRIKHWLVDPQRKGIPV